MLIRCAILIFINWIWKCAIPYAYRKLQLAFRLEISVYSRSDKHLISKMEKPKVAKHFWNFLVKASCSFKNVFFKTLCFPNCLFGCSGTHPSFYLILHFTPHAVGGGFPPMLVFGPLLPSLSTFFPLSYLSMGSFPSVEGSFSFLSPLSSGFSSFFPFYIRKKLPSPKAG